MEVFTEQQRELQRLSKDQSQTKNVRQFYVRWIEDIAAAVPLHQPQVGADIEKWPELCKWIPSSYSRGQPASIPRDEWYVLHVLPYITRQWTATTMGAIPRGQWYHDYPILQLFCGQVEQGDWSAAIRIPAGLTWEECEDVSAYPPVLQARK